MDFTKDTGKKFKFDVEKDGEVFHFTGVVQDGTNSQEVKFIDKFGALMRVPADKIVFAEEVVG